MTPQTRESLLIRVRDADDVGAWQQFVSIYRPMIYRIARRRGLQDSDAEDLSQRVLLSVARAIGTWQKDPERGNFRGWLTRVARNAIVNFATRKPRELAIGGSEFLETVQKLPSDSDEIEDLIRQEHSRSRLRLAAEMVKSSVSEQTWSAFWRTTIDGESIRDVAQQLEMTLGAVYGARGRVMKQLQRVFAQLPNGHRDSDWIVDDGGTQ